MRTLALVAVGIGIALPAAAEPRVAFVNAAHDGDAGSAAIDRLRPAVADHTGLAALGAGDIRSALEAPIDVVAKTRDAIERATALANEAREAVTQFDYPTALSRIADAEALLVNRATSPRVLNPLSELNLLAGVVHTSAGDRGKARAAFGVAYRLAPDRAALDRGTYPPKVVRAYAQAVRAAKQAKLGTLAVETRPAGATVYVDGQPAEGSVEIAAGVHYVVASEPRSGSAGQRVTVARGKTTTATLELTPLTGAERIRALRSELRDASEEPARSEAASELARSAGVRWLVTVRQSTDGTLVAATFDADKQTLSAWEPLDQRDAMLATLPAGVPAAVPLTTGGAVAGNGTGRPDLVTTRRAKPDRPWYSTWWGRGVILGTVAVAATAVVIYTGDDGPPTYDIDRFCGLGEPCN